jgi:hypothetical protein
MVYAGACLIAGIRLARERQINAIQHGIAIGRGGFYLNLTPEQYDRLVRPRPLAVEG